MNLCHVFVLFWTLLVGAKDVKCEGRRAYSTKAGKENGRRVYGGEQATIDRYPYQVQIVPMPKRTPQPVVYSSCGAAIISERAIITAGHCLRKGHHNPNNYLVRAGTSYRNGYKGSLHRVVDIRTHDSYMVYRRQHSHNDIAVLFVDPPFLLDETRQKIPIAITPATPGERAVSTGWGFMDLKKTMRPKTLQAVPLRVIDREACNLKSNWKGMIDPNNFCAGVLGDSGSCKGDSGGPLAMNGRLVGVVSWGYSKRCAKVGHPSVFTNVTAYVPWIQSQTEGEDVLYV